MIKHIRMPKAIAEAWLKDLRANPKQGRFRLQDEQGGHCCLGRLQIVVSGDVERRKNGRSFQMPSLEWLKDNNIEFFNRDDSAIEFPHSNTSFPYCNRFGVTFPTINDTTSTSFPEIADLLEEEIEYND